jgi:hypothetical protein
MFKALHYFRAELGAVLEADATNVNLPGLVEQLGADHTFLRLAMGREFEIVAVSATAGQLELVRGQEGTKARKWPKGAMVDWIWTQTSICQMIACGGCAGAPGMPVGPKVCGDDDCCTKVGYVPPPQIVVPQAGKRWELVVQLQGSPDFSFGEADLPAWIDAQIIGDVLLLAGTPKDMEPGRKIIIEIENVCSSKAIVLQLPNVLH